MRHALNHFERTLQKGIPMKQSLRSATNDDLHELSQEESAGVSGGVIDTGVPPTRTRVPGRLTPDDDEDGTMAGAPMGW
jgi:hypothetical protein